MFKNSPNGRAIFCGFSLALIASLCVFGVLSVEHQTEGRIQDIRLAHEQQMLKTMLPQVANSQRPVSYECRLLSDKRIGKNMRTFIAKDSSTQQPVGLIASYSTSRGYSNPLILVAGIDNNGKVTRVDVKLTKETPGIGDKVEHRKGNYLDQFVGKGLYDATWEVEKFGGDFDSITGATVTSRAVVLATRDLLQVLAETDPALLPPCPNF